MTYSFSALEEHIADIREWISQEYSGIRTGQATPALLDTIKIDAYGTRSQISHVASVTTEGPRTLRVVPWDKGQIKDIEKAIISGGLGASVSVDADGVRVNFPELTEENRKNLTKLVRTKLEDARVSVRAERDKTWNDIQKKEKEGEITEDEKFRLKDEMQKRIDEANTFLEEKAQKKEKEIMGV